MPVQKIRSKIYFIVSLIISISISFFWGKYLPFRIQKTLASAITGVSSILFGVLGIWIGLMAPESLKAIYTSKDSSHRINHWNSLESLYKPVFLSLILFVITTSYSFTGELLKIIPFCAKNIYFFRSVGSFIIAFSLFLSFYLVFLAIKPGIEMLAESFLIVKRSEKMDDIFPDK